MVIEDTNSLFKYNEPLYRRSSCIDILHHDERLSMLIPLRAEHSANGNIPISLTLLGIVMSANFCNF